ncbi:MASE3 domain-containing protein [Desulforhabdus sp. TSK]|uniref:MASE3 domain-containing protein n=1 Tax=Desulforhabdus sp. TSK TaxID=2925014 RepID=UPI001FC7F4C5|nr:MASE3 domain-containing protein [Desulforhabdus sp. TSK]
MSTSWDLYGMIGRFLAGMGLLAGLYALSLYSFLLFHSLVELFTVAVTGALFLLAWNSRQFAKDDALVFLGCANLCTGIVILLHMLAYKGMGVFVQWPGANLATQLWIVVRILESLSFLAFVGFIGRRIHPFLSLGFCLGATAFLLCSIFLWNTFPACYIEGSGLTRFKVVSEYIVCFLLAGAMTVLHSKRRHLDFHVYRLLMSSIFFAVMAGLAFTAYVSVFGPANLFGHYFHLVSYFLLYLALIQASLTRPYGTLFRELNAAREDAARRERYHRAILDQLHENIRIIDPAGIVVEANRAFLESRGLKREEVVGLPYAEKSKTSGDVFQAALESVFADGKPRSEIYGHGGPDGNADDLTNVRDSGESRNPGTKDFLDPGFHRGDVKSTALGADGVSLHEDILFSPLRDENGSVFQLIAAGRDITELVGTRRALELRVRELDTIMESTEDGILALDGRGKVLQANRRFLQMWGLTLDALSSDENMPVAQSPDGAIEGPPGFMPVLCAAQSSVEGDCTTLRLEDGRTVEWYAHPLYPVEDRSGVVWSFRDVTARRRMEARLADSERRLRTLIEEAPISIMTFDADGTVDFVNQYHLKLFARNHFEKDFFLARKITELPGLIRAGCAGELEPVLKGQPVFLDDVYFPEAHPGFTGYQRVKAVPIPENGEMVGGILLREDITRYRQAMDALRGSLEEKIVLLRELHHRVKNNLQIVASLLGLQSSRVGNPEIVEVLRDTRNRVRSMSLLHEMLYKSTNLARIDFKPYIRDLCGQLLLSYGSAASMVRVENRVSPIGLPLEQSVPCGLIVNELVSNALKHGFPDGRSGRVTVELFQTDEGALVLSVRDDGVGLPVDLDPSNNATLGLQLVSRLAAQLGGRLKVDRPDAGGTAIGVVFPVPSGTSMEGKS